MELLKEYLKFCITFKGRINRKVFLLYQLWFGSCLLFSYLLKTILLPENYTPPISISILSSILSIVFLFPLIVITFIGILSCCIKRSHDLNLSGWWYIIFTIALEVVIDDNRSSRLSGLLPFPIASGITLIVFLITTTLYVSLIFIKGTTSKNKYGPDPLKKL